MVERGPVRFPFQKKRGSKVLNLRFNLRKPKDLAAYNLWKTLGAENIRRFVGCADYETLEAHARSIGLSPSQFVREKLARGYGELTAEEQSGIIRGNRDLLDLDTKSAPFSLLGLGLEDSPAKVRALIDKFAPDASCILDPFAGTANTAIVAGQRGIQAYYTEIDPVLRFIAEAKIGALTLSESGRAKLLDALRSAKLRIKTKIGDAKMAPDLQMRPVAFPATANISADRAADLLQVGRAARVVVDSWFSEGGAFTDILAAAFASALLRVTELEASGDETVHARALLDHFRDAAAEELANIIEWVRKMEPLQKVPRCLTGDARHLGDVLCDPVDTVITNPPLFTLSAPPGNAVAHWFLRLPGDPNWLEKHMEKRGVKSAADARELVGKAPLKPKSSVLMSGGADAVDTARAINGLQKVINALDAKGSHDVAIAAANYFIHMAGVLRAVAGKLTDDACLIIETSDSRFGDERVATDILLSNLVALFGFRQESGFAVDAEQSTQATRRVLVFRRSRARTN